MDENKEAVTEEAVEPNTTQDVSPASEAPTTEEQTVETQETEGQEVSESEGTDEESPRDYQIRRLAEENRRLKEERKARSQGESAFQAFRPQIPTGAVQTVRVEDHADPITGEINWGSYNQAVQARDSKLIEQAKWEAQQTASELFEENDARQKFPQLFEDPEAEQEVADLWLAAKLRGQKVTVTEIAGKVAKRYQKAVSKAEKAGAEKVLSEVSEKEAAGLEASSQNSNQASRSVSQDERNRLATETRKGNTDAIAERLKSIPWANK
jgi:hypothetical protein